MALKTGSLYLVARGEKVFLYNLNVNNREMGVNNIKRNKSSAPRPVLSSTRPTPSPGVTGFHLGRINTRD